MGGAGAGWERHEWVPLCRTHHDLVDGRLGVSKDIEAARQFAKEIIEEKRRGQP